MGSDGFKNLDKWKNYETLIKEHKFYIYKRSDFDVINTLGAQIVIMDAPMLDISSTRIRKLLKEKKSIRYLVPDIIKEEIENNNYYK